MDRRDVLKLGAGAAVMMSAPMAFAATNKDKTSPPPNIKDIENRLKNGNPDDFEIPDTPHFNFIHDTPSGIDFAISSGVKGVTLAADAAFMYAAFCHAYPEILKEKKYRDKLNGAITLAHGVLAGIGTISTKYLADEFPKLKTVFISVASTIAITYALAEQSPAEEEGHKDTKALSEATQKKNIAMLAASPMVLAVSYDALFSAFGKAGAMDARGLTGTEIIISTIVMSAVIYGCLKMVDWIAVQKNPENAVLESMKKFIKEKVTELKLKEHIITTFGMNKDATEEEVIMKLVFVLIASFGIRGTHNAFGYEGLDMPGIGTSLEGLLGSIAISAIDARTGHHLANGSEKIMDASTDMVKRIFKAAFSSRQTQQN